MLVVALILRFVSALFLRWSLGDLAKALQNILPDFSVLFALSFVCLKEKGKLFKLLRICLYSVLKMLRKFFSIHLAVFALREHNLCRVIFNIS